MLSILLPSLYYRYIDFLSPLDTIKKGDYFMQKISELRYSCPACGTVAILSVDNISGVEIAGRCILCGRSCKKDLYKARDYAHYHNMTVDEMLDFTGVEFHVKYV